MVTITREQFRQITKSNILLPATVFEKTDDLYETFASFSENGANVLIAPTFLYENEREKLEVFRTVSNAASDKAFVCTAVKAPEEKTIYSGGTLTFDAYYEKIKSEVSFLYKNAPGAMLYLIGFQTLPETKYAVLAAREVSDLPICVLLDFAEDSESFGGYDILTTTITLQSLGINALGVMAEDSDITLEILMTLKEFTTVPLFAFPNANHYITPTEYAQYAQDFVNQKCVMFGGGKGTDERHIAQIAKELWQLEPFAPDFPMINAVCGKNQIYFMDFNDKVVGNNKTLLEIDLENLSKTDDVDALIEKLLQNGLPPVCFKTKDLEILERAMKVYPSRPAIVSDEYGEISAKEYGAIILNQNKGES